MRAQAHFQKNDQTAAVAEAANDPIKVRPIESNASRSRMARAPPSMDEYRRTQVRNGIRPIVSDHDEQIVEPVGLASRSWLNSHPDLRSNSLL